MVSGKSMVRILDKSDLEAVHGATMRVLDDVGVKIDSPETLDLLVKNGFEVDRKSKIVRMPESKVMEAVNSCRKNFKWHARNEKHSIDFVDGRTKFGPGAQCLYYINLIPSA